MTQDKTHKVPNVPPLRFPEFIGEWEKFGFADHLERLENGANYDTNATEGLPMSRIETIASYNINYDKVGHCNSRNIEHYKMKYGDILFSHINSMSHIGKTAYYYAEQPLYHGMNLLLIRCKDNLNSLFFYYLLNTPLFLRYCQIYAKQAVNQASISTSDIKRIKLSLPTLHEQNKIASFISVIDQRIATQNKIIQHLESLIKGICKMLLAKQGNTFIKDCLVCNSSTLQESSVLPCGKYPVYGATGISGYLDVPQVEHDAILIIKDGAGVGNVRYATDKHGVIGTLNYLSAKNGYNLKYLYYCLRIFNFTPFVTGLAIPHIYFRDYGSSKIYCPSLTEQKHIANNLSNIERKIENEKQLLEKLKEQKKYLLSQMFI